MRFSSSSWKMRSLAAALLLSPAAFFGCQGMPTAPVTEVQDPSRMLPPSAQMLAKGGSNAPGQIKKNSIVAAVPDTPDSTGSRTFALRAATGGSFTFGRYTVQFPPGAVSGDGRVTISVPDGTVIGCDLSIDPPALNNFVQLATLTIDMHKTNVKHSNLGTLQVWLAQTDGWVDEGGTFDVQGWSISEQIPHFSVRRAGW